MFSEVKHEDKDQILETFKDVPNNLRVKGYENTAVLGIRQNVQLVRLSLGGMMGSWIDRYMDYLVDELAYYWGLINGDQEFFHEPPIGLDAFLEHAEKKNWIPDSVDRKWLRRRLENL